MKTLSGGAGTLTLSRRVVLRLLVSLAVMLAGNAQAHADKDNKPDAISEPAVRFRPDGTLKIMQLTDLHYKHGKGASRRVNQLIDRMIEAERPDLILITGDLFYSDHIAKMIDEVFPEILDSGIPFGVMMGNHDDQHELTRPEIYDLVQTLPGSVMPPREGRYSPNYVVEVAPSEGEGVAATLYCLDSDTTTPYWGVGKYAWIGRWKIDWYANLSNAYKAANGGKPMPSLMFFHIPTPEYSYAIATMDRPVIGTNGEPVSCPAVNSGLFAALVEQGDVSGVFCGHDHDNDFATMYYDVLLAYGRYSGGKTVYTHLGEPGVRMIELREGSRDFRTWVRLLDGRVIDEVEYPNSFLTPKEIKARKR